MTQHTYIYKFLQHFVPKNLYGKGVGKKSSFSRDGEQRGTSAENRCVSEINDKSSHETFILLGPPGSGKSTEAKILKRELGLEHIEIGSELRKAALKETDLGKLINEIVYQKKELVPDGIVGRVLNDALQGIETGVLLDGAPRRLSQIDEVEEILTNHNRKMEKVIYLTLSLEQCVERISRRFLCQNCKAAYKQGKDTEVETGICSLCQGEVSQRYDDTPEGVAKRYQVFHDQTIPVINHYKEKGMLVEVSADGDPEAIASDILEAFKK